MTKTTRLSDRLELRPCTAGGGYDLIADDDHVTWVRDVVVDALVALARPPACDLPSGVIAGSDGRFYAPGDVVRTLPDDMWTFHYPHSGKMVGLAHGDASHGFLYEVRPTADNPVPTLPEHTWRAPGDERLFCFRRHAATLRAHGATLHYTDADDEVDTSSDVWSGQVLEVQFPPPAPATEDVPWWEAVGRKRSELLTVIEVGHDKDGPWIYDGNGRIHSAVDASGRVTVLVDGDQRKDVTR